MASIDLDFGTLNLDSTINVTISRIQIKDSKPVQTHLIPQMDGAIAEEAKLGSKTITIEGDISGSSYTDMRTNIDSLRTGLLNGLQKFTTDDERYIMAQLKDFSFTYDHLSRYAKWSASFIAHFPFWLSETLNSDSRVPTSGVGYAITNAGNAPARAKITVTAPGGGIVDNCQIENSTTGLIVKYRGTITQYLDFIVNNRVDNDDFEVTNDDVDDFENLEGDFITLNPGANAIIYTGTANAIVEIEWRDCWY